ncbi:HPr family phosphocarrier protein [Bacillus sp. SRB_336]|nr:HPr family phosphocarrier protein [Bacillus sp. SRB_336]
MSERKATVASSSGLHARPASLFAEAAGNAGVEVTIAMDGAPADDAMDASSILSLMTLGAEHGSVVVLRAEGEGADAALDKLVEMLETDLDAM